MAATSAVVDESLDLDDQSLIILLPADADRGARLDKFIADQLPDYSRSTVQTMIENGSVLVDGFMRKSKFRVTPGERVAVTFRPAAVDEIQPDDVSLDVVYEDRDVIVVDKPAGMVVHPAPGHARGTLANALVAHVPGLAVGGSQRPGIVHRLDKDTSGLIVAAKTDRGRTALVAQWARGEVEKTYIALVSGLIPDHTATIDAPIGRDPKHRQRMAVVRTGKRAVTQFRAVERFTDATLLELTIVTGRTHQIRVHLAFVGHPVIGDRVYGRQYRGEPLVERHFLHASELAFALPDGRPVRFRSPLPTELQTALLSLRSRTPA